MLFSLLQGDSITDIIIRLLLTLPVILCALSFHEAAHGYAAWKMGDPTAHNLGRLSLNPLKHLDPIGCLMMLLVGYGWAKPVPINTRYFRDPKKGMAITAAAGPAANLLIGLISIVLFAFFSACYTLVAIQTGEGFLLRCVFWLAMIFQLSALFNLVLMIFNLIPIPPFDGSRIAFAFLPQRHYFLIMRYERQIMLGLLVALMAFSYFFDFSPSAWLAEKLIDAIYPPLYQAFSKLLLPQDIFEYLFA